MNRFLFDDRSHADSSPQEISMESGKTEIRVLLIEDDAVDSQWVQRQLESYPGAHFRLISASLLEQALVQLDTAFFDAILLDLNLPDSHGGETILRTLLHSTNIPLIVLTGNRDRHLSDNARQRGAYAYLVKGLGTMTQLPSTIHEAVHERRLAQAAEVERATD